VKNLPYLSYSPAAAQHPRGEGLPFKFSHYQGYLLTLLLPILGSLSYATSAAPSRLLHYLHSEGGTTVGGRKPAAHAVRTRTTGPCARTLDLPLLVWSGVFFFFPVSVGPIFSVFFTPFPEKEISDSIAYGPIIRIFMVVDLLYTQIAGLGFS